jgi:YidC/Oxa1 family membrane protein insertase
MDRNSVVGLVLIGLILIGFSILNAPSEEELAVMKREQDSIALVQKQEMVKVAGQKANSSAIAAAPLFADTVNLNDSARAALLSDRLGAFADAGTGTESLVTIENDLMKVVLTSLGGRVKSVELKKYKTWDGKPVHLFESDSTKFGFNFFAQNRSISTNDLYFTPAGSAFKVTGSDSNSIAFRASAGSPNRYIEYVYTLHGDKYLVGYKVNLVGLNEVIAANTGYLELNWQQQIQSQEKDIAAERMNSTVYYMFSDDEVDYLSETEDTQEDLKTNVKWIAMKQHFFTQVLIADKTFDKPTRLVSQNGIEDQSFVKNITASFTVPYQHSANESFGMKFYFGPNHYQTLKKTGFNLEKQIPLGWGIFGWVNRFLVIPVFNFLSSFQWNYGLIILILTIVIKLVLTPFTYKSYLSQAKMKVLKPEVEEIQGKFKEEPMKMQQEMMALYRKAGVSPLGGCLPMLLQLPILIAMFRFFPQSIELRQESFLWAHDLSTYDSILDLPFTIPFYGAHVSLWTLLMTISTILITVVNSQSTAANPQMKMMLYLMPIFTLGIFNSYSAGLSYYYFLANVISIGQQYLFRAFVDDDAIHKQIQENKKKPSSQKKSKFQQRLEAMAKQKGYKLPK